MLHLFPVIKYSSNMQFLAVTTTGDGKRSISLWLRPMSVILHTSPHLTTHKNSATKRPGLRWKCLCEGYRICLNSQLISSKARTEGMPQWLRALTALLGDPSWFLKPLEFQLLGNQHPLLASTGRPTLAHAYTHSHTLFLSRKKEQSLDVIMCL